MAANFEPIWQLKNISSAPEVTFLTNHTNLKRSFELLKSVIRRPSHTTFKFAIRCEMIFYDTQMAKEIFSGIINRNYNKFLIILPSMYEKICTNNF